MLERNSLIISRAVERLCVRIIFLGSAAIFVTPLIVTQSALFPYVVSKALVFRIIVEMLVVPWIFLCIYRPSYRPNLKHPLSIASLVLSAVVLLGTIASQDPWYSFWSIQERMSGTLLHLHVWVWFLMLISVVKDWFGWRVLLRTTLTVSLLVTLYGIGQRGHLSFLPADPDVHRFASSLGNPIYLGVYAFFHIFFSAYLAVRERHNLWKGYAAFGVLVNTFVLLFSASRGVALSLAVTFFLFCVALVWLIGNRRTARIYRIVLTVLFAVSLSLFIFFQLPLGKQVAQTYLPSFVNKVLYSSFHDPNRLALWKVGMLGFRDKPIFGWGWENFAMVNDLYAPRLLTPQSSPWNDRAHNQLIDILVFAGIVGIVAYGFLWFAIGKTLREIFSRSGHSFRFKLLWLILVLLFVGYFLQNLTAFDTPLHLIFLAFSLALLYFIHQEGILGDQQSFARKEQRELREREWVTPFPTRSIVFGIVLAALPGLSIYFFHAVPFQKSQQLINAVKQVPTDAAGALHALQAALDTPYSFTNIETREQMVEFIDRIVEHPGFSEETKKAYVLLTAEQAVKSAEEHPRYLRYYLRAVYALRLASKYDPLIKERAFALAKKASEMYPDRYEPYLELAEIASLKEDREQMIEYGKKMAELDPRPARSVWYLAWLYSRVGDNRNALARMEQALMADCRVGVYGDNIYLIAEKIRPEANPILADLFHQIAVMGPAGDYRLLLARQMVIDKVRSALESSDATKKKR